MPSISRQFVITDPAMETTTNSVETTGEGRDAHHQLHQISQPHAHHAAVAITEVFAQLIHEL